MRKLTLVAGIGIGYVLGTKAGRGRYEQIRSKAQQTWQDPRVQEKAAAAQDLVAQKAPKVAEKAQQVASGVSAKVTGSGTRTDSAAASGAGAPDAVSPDLAALGDDGSFQSSAGRLP